MPKQLGIHEYTIYLDKVTHIDAIVIDEAGTPIPAAQCLFLRTNNSGTDSFTKTTDEQGKLHLPFFAGQIALSLTAKGFARQTIELGNLSTPPERLAITLTRGRTGYGQLWAENGQPIPNATIRILATREGLPSILANSSQTLIDDETTTNEQGQFTTNSLAPDRNYQLRITSDGKELEFEDSTFSLKQSPRNITCKSPQ